MVSAIVLAGGRGNKFFPYATIRNKVCFPILGTPCVLRLANQLIQSGVKNIVIVTGYKEQSVRYALRNLKEVTFAKTEGNEDIATAIRKAIDLVETEDVLIIHGDIVTTEQNIKEFLSLHKSSNSEVSMLISENPPEPIHTLRVYISSNEFDCFDYDGKSSIWFCNAIIGNTYIIRKSALNETGYSKDVPVGAMPEPQGSLISIIEAIKDSNVSISVIKSKDFLIDLNHPWDALKANQLVLHYLFESLEENKSHDTAKISDGADISSNAKIIACENTVIEKGCIVQGNLYLGRGSQISKGAIVSENVFIGHDSLITEYSKLHADTVIGNNNRIAFSAEFYGLTLDNVFMIHNCCISGILGSNVDIGAGTISATWRFDNKVREIICEGRKEMPPYYGNLSYIGDFCRTGVGVMLMPGVRVGAYSCLGPGTIIRTDIQPNTLILCEQKLNIEKWGPEKYNNY